MVVDVAEHGVENLLVHDETNPTMSYLLSQLRHPEFPTPTGVFKCVQRPTYDSLLNGQVEEAKARKPGGSVQALIEDAHVWTVE